MASIVTEPYYSDESVTLYHGDAANMLATVTADVTITDPPYNVGKDYGGHDDAQPADVYEEWLRGLFSALRTNDLVFFPGKVNVLRISEVLRGTGYVFNRMLGWHKREYAGDVWTGGPAMCWEPIVWASRGKPVFNRIFGAWGRDFLVVPSTHGDPFKGPHPCPKPEPVMRWLVGLFCPPGGTVLDPFAGTGATLRSAKDLGRRSVGIEINRAYCDLAVRRLSQEVMAL